MITKTTATDNVRAFRLNAGARIQSILVGNSQSGVIGGAYNYLADGFVVGGPAILAIIANVQSFGWTVVDDGISTITMS